jgi:hypothetical protein
VNLPAVLIRLEVEASPRLQIDALNESEQRCLVDWLEAHPRYLKLIQDALALERQERAA